MGIGRRLVASVSELRDFLDTDLVATIKRYDELWEVQDTVRVCRIGPPVRGLARIWLLGTSAREPKIIFVGRGSQQKGAHQSKLVLEFPYTTDNAARQFFFLAGLVCNTLTHV